MAIIDVVKWESNPHEIAHKFPSENLRLGTQLVVHAGQTAFFVKGGQVLDSFESGTHTIKTANIPLLGKLINLPFGGDTPFQAEVWFVNTLAILDTKWGTPSPIQLEDPKYEVIVPVRAFGQYGIKVSDPRLLIESLVGNMATFSVSKIDAYFKGVLLSRFANLLSDKMNKDGISILTINSHLNELSEFIVQSLQPDFNKYGVGFENFYVVSVNVPEDDPSFIKLKEAKELMAKIKIAGRDIYQMDRSFNVLETAAGNEGTAGNLIGVGMGMNAGMGFAGQMSNLAGQHMNTQAAAPPPIPQPASYFIAVNGQQQGPYDTITLTNYIAQGQIQRDTLVWKNGMPNWAQISTLPEFANSFGAVPPPLPPQP